MTIAPLRFGTYSRLIAWSGLYKCPSETVGVRYLSWHLTCGYESWSLLETALRLCHLRGKALDPNRYRSSQSGVEESGRVNAVFQGSGKDV